MAQYRDMNGVQHVVQIDMDARDRVAERTEWDLLKMAHEPQRLSEFLAAIQLDDSLIYEVLSAIKEVPVVTLKKAADGSTHEEASTALLEALVDFFPKGSAMKVGLQKLLNRVETAQDQARQAISEQIEAAVEALDIQSMASTAADPMSG
jgi:predicted RNA polymerase sigma factor